MFDSTRLDVPPSEVLSTGIFFDERGHFDVGPVGVASYEDAQLYLLKTAQQQSTSRLILETDAAIERLLANRELLRAQAADLAADCAKLHVRDDGQAFENEWQHLTSVLAVDAHRAESTVSNQLGTAQQRCTELPLTMQAWQDGRIHQGHVIAIERAASTITEESRGEFEAEALPKADGRTPQQLAPVARRIARKYESVSMQKNHADAFKERAVWVTPSEHGMATLNITTSAVLADAVVDRLRRAYKNRPEGDPRGLHQFMSDTALAVLLTGTCDSGWLDNIRAEVVVTMPATMLTAEETGSAELPAGQLVDDDTALLLAGSVNSWTRLFTHPVTGVAITADTYAPTTALRRFIVHRDRTCRFPGCARIAKHADVDHTNDWQHGGKTTPDNLACLCRHHHTLKHRLGADDGWRVRQLDPGVLEWVDPHGRIRRTEPEPAPTAVIIREHPEQARW
ncbi:DUF222 domain-containing protein [Agrococcus casei]|uniref:HNH endonuclease signature motif containing protein n=1 Tax=Agrococcus casei TaxID=343512 RepID=UPI003F913D6E